MSGNVAVSTENAGISATTEKSKDASAALSASQREFVLRSFILFLICAVSFSIRLFSVLRYESIIHEFDPWFNFRSTK